MIDREQLNVTEPPITKDMPLEELQNFNEKREPLPCHSQATKRLVKMVTEASTIAVGSDKQDAITNVRITSRNARPKFNTKSQFKVSDHFYRKFLDKIFFFYQL